MLIISFEGILVNFISYPVINAFTSAAAITIGFGQVKVKEHAQRLFKLIAFYHLFPKFILYLA